MPSISPYPFCLDVPAGKVIPRRSRFSGWYLAPQEHKPQLVLHLNDEPYVALDHGLPRPDVAVVYPDHETSDTSGFVGDLWIYDGLVSSDTFDVSIWDHGFKDPRHLIKRTMTVNEKTGGAWRRRNYDLADLLQCTGCSGSLAVVKRHWECKYCGNSGLVRGPAFFFLDKGLYPSQTVFETTKTAQYGEGALDLLERAGNGLVLDFGAGNSPDSALRANICYLDIQQYAHTDVISPGIEIPFKDNCFDAVVSQSVFEHIPDPFMTARELYRVLKPGGEIFVDTAFMQPFHAGPSHYFNMSKYGLRRVFHMFEEKEVGIAPYHLPSFGLMMQLDMVLPDMVAGEWKTHLQEFREHLGRDNQGLDRDLGPIGRERLAAGWFFRGFKPR